MYTITNNSHKSPSIKIKSKTQCNINIYRNMSGMNDPAFRGNQTLKDYINNKLKSRPLQNKTNPLKKHQNKKPKEIEKTPSFIFNTNLCKTNKKNLKNNSRQETSSNDNNNLYSLNTTKTLAYTYYKNRIIQKINSPRRSAINKKKQNKSAKVKKYYSKNNSFIIFNYNKKLQNKPKYANNSNTTCFSTSTDNYTNLCANINNQLSILNSIHNNFSNSCFNSNAKRVENPPSKIKLLKNEINYLIKINKNELLNKNNQNPVNNNNLEDKLNNLQNENNILKEKIQNSNNQISLLEKKIEKLLKNEDNDNSKENQCPIPMPYVKRYSHEFKVVDKLNSNNVSNKRVIKSLYENTYERNVSSPLAKTNNINSMKNNDNKKFSNFSEYKLKSSASFLKNNMGKKSYLKKKNVARSKGF